MCFFFLNISLVSTSHSKEFALQQKNWEKLLNFYFSWVKYLMLCLSFSLFFSFYKDWLCKNGLTTLSYLSHSFVVFCMCSVLWPVHKQNSVTLFRLNFKFADANKLLRLFFGVYGVSECLCLDYSAICWAE